MNQNCNDCMWAQWAHDKLGRIRPRIAGRCTYMWKPPPLPSAYYFYGTYSLDQRFPKPAGGLIEWGGDKTAGCPTYKEREGDESRKRDSN